MSVGLKGFHRLDDNKIGYVNSKAKNDQKKWWKYGDYKSDINNDSRMLSSFVTVGLNATLIIICSYK